MSVIQKLARLQFPDGTRFGIDYVPTDDLPPEAADVGANYLFGILLPGETGDEAVEMFLNGGELLETVMLLTEALRHFNDQHDLSTPLLPLP